MIEARNLTRRYGPTVAVDALSFDVRPGDAFFRLTGGEVEYSGNTTTGAQS